MIFAHPFSDIVVTKVLEPLWKRGLTKRQELIVWVTGIVSTIFPDVDLAYAILTRENHRFLVTHTFLPYVLLAGVVLILTFVLSKKLLSFGKDFLAPKFIRLLVPIMLIGISLHLVTDTLGAPVRLLYPFSNQEFIFLPINSFLHSSNLNVILRYYTTPLFFAIELFWISFGSYIVYKKTNTSLYIKKYLPRTVGLAVASAATMLVIVLISRLA